MGVVVAHSVEVLSVHKQYLPSVPLKMVTRMLDGHHVLDSVATATWESSMIALRERRVDRERERERARAEEEGFH